MATLVQLSSKPGGGKTASLRTLPPAQTVIIDADKKGLSWTGWKKDYNSVNKNYFSTSSVTDMVKILNFANSDPNIKYVAIDTINSIMSDREVADTKRAGFDKWKDMAIDVYELYDLIRGSLRDDLIVITTAHIEPYEADGETHWRTKLNGRYLSKLNFSSKLNYNLYCQVERSGQGEAIYSFITQSDGKNEARSPMGVLPYKMPNDMLEVCKKIEESES